jgi:hypothetical protein
MSSASDLATSASLGLTPSRTTLVESHTSARTPSSPSARKASSEVSEPRYGGVVDLPVARVDHEARRRADRDGVRFRDRVGDRHVFEVEGPELQALARLDLVQVDLRGVGLAEAAGFEQADGEARGIDRHLQAGPQLGQRADVVLVGVGDEDAQQIVALLLDEAQVRVDEIDAGQVLLAAEAHAEVDQNPLPVRLRPVAVEGRVHADLAEAAERHEDEFVLGRRHIDQDPLGPELSSAVVVCKSGK